MAYHGERWSRGCGTGIGLSGHTNQYRLEVLIENWVEISLWKAAHLAGAKIVGAPGAVVDGTTTMQASYTDAGKTGMDLMKLSERQDLEPPTSDVEKEHLFHHGLAGQPTADCDATLNSLAYADPAAGPKQKVHQVLWAGSKFNDSNVPQKGDRHSAAGFAKAKAAQEMKGWDMYQTHSKATSEQCALMAAGAPAKRDLILPQSVGGQAAQIGRKAKGSCASFFDATYQKIGLRK